MKIARKIVDSLSIEAIVAYAFVAACLYKAAVIFQRI